MTCRKSDRVPRSIQTPLARTGAVFAALALLLAGAAPAQEVLPGWEKSFAPDTIGPGSVSTLTFEITNGSRFGIRGLAFVDKLPAGVVIADPPNISSDCGGTLTAVAGGNIIELTDGNLPGSSACAISIDVTSAEFGTHTNQTGDLTSEAGNSGGVSADLIVAENLPGFSKGFEPSTVSVGGRTTLTFTIDNSANEGGRAMLTFSDTLPFGMVVANPANASTTCGGGQITAVPGSNTISYAPGPPFFNDASVGGFEICTLSVDVICNAVGIIDNVSGELTSTTGPQDFTPVSSGKASASIRVTTRELLVTKSFTDDPVPPGGTTRLEFTITNRSRDESASEITFVDDLEATLPGLVSTSQPQTGICGPRSVIEGTSRLKFSGGSLGPGESCTFSVSLDVPAEARPGVYPNATSPVEAVIGARRVELAPATDSLFVRPAPIFTKEFIDDPVTPGGAVTLEFTITNTSPTSVASEVAFVDELPPELPTALEIPKDGFCGPGSVASFTPASEFSQAMIAVSGISLRPRESCSFRFILAVEASANSGIVTNTTGPITALIDDQTVTGRPASDDLFIVSGPRLRKSFLDDPVLPGGTTRLQFTLSHSPEAPAPLEDIRFTDDLNAALPGLLAANLPLTDVCGAGSIARGTSVIDFRGGSLRPGETCSFIVELKLPEQAPVGRVTNTTSPVTARLGGVPVTSAAATDELLVTTVMLTKAFKDDFVIPGGTATLAFTIDNAGDLAATDLAFTDDLGTVLPGLMSLSADQSNICGDGSALVSTQAGGLLVFSGGSVPGGSSCSFSVEVQVPPSAEEGTYTNVTSELSATIGEASLTLPPATAALEVRSSLLQIAKSFATNPVQPGGTTDLEFTITNLHPTQTASAITFTDDLGAAIPGMRSTSGTRDNICGAGSRIAGTDVLTFTGGRLAGGASCAFSVTVAVPPQAAPDVYTNTTSALGGEITRLAVRGDPAIATLAVDPTPPRPDGVPFQIDRVEVSRNGRVLLEWTGIPGLRYCVETSVDCRVWTVVGDPIVGEVDPVQFIGGGPLVGRRFYRVVEKLPRSQ